MNNPPNSPLSGFVDAFSSTLGRCLAFCLAIVLPYLVLGLFFSVGLSVLPLVVFGSVLTGWGLLIYSALFLGGFWYVRAELSRWWLLVPVAVCSLDLWRVSHAFAK